MRWKSYSRQALLSLCCLTSLQWTSAAVTSATEESAEAEETTEVAKPKPEQWNYPRPCFVEKSKVEELIVQMNSTVRILNRDNVNLQCQRQEKLELKTMDENVKICSEERIQRIQKDLFKVAGSLFQHAIRLTEPSEEEIDFLDLIKFRVVEDLRALSVYVPLPCGTIAPFPFHLLVATVDESFGQVYALFNATRPTRPPPPTTHATPTTTPKPTVDDMLNPEKSFAELIEITELNPSAMTKAIPQIISRRYNERISTFDKLLAFVKALPSIENQVTGFAAVYDEMHRYIRDPEFSKLAKLAESVKLLNESAATSLNFTDTPAHVKLVDLIHDLSPIAKAMATTSTSAPTTTSAKPIPGLEDMLDPEKSFAELLRMAESNPSLMSRALPKIVSQRYSRRVSTFDNLLDFMNAMPTNENKIIGFSAVYDEMHGHNHKPDASQLLKFAKYLRHIITFVPATLNVVAKSKLDELTEDPDLRPLIFMLNPEKSLQELAEWAQLNPTAMPIALSEIISQRYNGSDSQFEAILKFVQGLPTIENKVIGFSAVHNEMRRYDRKPEKLQLEKLAKHVRHIIASVPATLNVVARSKLDELAEEPDLSPLLSILSPEWSLQELAEMARSNATSMTIALPEIISQRYNGSDSQFEAILKFVQGLPTTENKIIGFVAVYDEMHRHNQTTNLAQLVKLAKKVEILNEAVWASWTFANSATKLKWTNLMLDLSSLMVIGEKAECQITNVAYGTQLTSGDPGWPESAYVYPDPKLTMQIYPAIQNYKIFFRLYVDSPLFASDTNTNTHPDTTKYQYKTKTSERYVLHTHQNRLPTNAEIDWKFVAVPDTANQFRILSAKHDDFMFAHKSATGIAGWRRVLLGKKDYSDHDHIANADIWTLDCKPGTFSIPSV